MLNFIWKLKKGHDIQLRYGSYANGLGLEFIAYVCNYILAHRPRYLFVMHNDVLATKEGWFSYLSGKINDKVRGAAVSRDNIRCKAMHVSGLLLDFSLFNTLGMSFLPDHPRYLYDVGDLITLKLREQGYSYFICPNTQNDPSLISKIPEDSPFRLHSDRAFDDRWDIIFMHMGRGTLKAIGKYKTKIKDYVGDWLKFAREILNLEW
jgi:hypothetical protein